MSKQIVLFTSPVLHGDKAGRTIGFPTLNLDPHTLPHDTKQGVHAAVVTISGKRHLGALYLGPRLVKNETHTVLEVYILDFSEEIYGQTVQFCLTHFIRPVLHFTSLEELKLQLAKDVTAVRATQVDSDT